MKRLLSVALCALLTGCLIDPGEVLSTADLTIEVQNAADLKAHALEVVLLLPDGRTVTKHTERIAERTELLFEQGSVGEGRIALTLVALSEDGRELGCDGATVEVKRGDRISRVLQSTDSNPAHCGACNTTCDAERGSRICQGGACGPLICAPGFADEDGRLENGCEADTGCYPVSEGDEASCGNGIDDDCDGRIDCEDDGCNGHQRACAANAGCTGTQSWDCSAKAWTECVADTQAERTPELCSDELDNDCDGKTDCKDSDCNRLELFCHPPGTKCLGIRIWTCLTGSISLCQLTQFQTESSPESCSDGNDNDCDGKVDCEDPGCRGQACTEGSACCVEGRCGACN